jgi:hypothetical protein
VINVGFSRRCWQVQSVCSGLEDNRASSLAVSARARPVQYGIPQSGGAVVAFSSYTTRRIVRNAPDSLVIQCLSIDLGSHRLCLYRCTLKSSLDAPRARERQHEVGGPFHGRILVVGEAVLDWMRHGLRLLFPSLSHITRPCLIVRMKDTM